MGKMISHGTATGYQAHKCRCQPCREANTEAKRKFRERRRALNPPPTQDEKFWQKVEKTDSCWNWTGFVNPGGYGTVKIDGALTGAHRASYEKAFGPIPEGLCIDHMCHNRSCVRPDHLRLATTKQNGENRKGASGVTRSGVRGVSWNNLCNKWQGRVRHSGKTYHAGVFETVEDAEAAVIALRNELFTHNILDRAA